MIQYKECSTFVDQLIIRADRMLNSNSSDFKCQEISEITDIDISDEEFNQIEKSLPDYFQAICNPREIDLLDCLKKMHSFVGAHQFNLDKNLQFLDAQFAEGIRNCLNLEIIQNQRDFIIKETVLILCNLWFYHPKDMTPLTDPSFIIDLFEIYNLENFAFLHESIFNALNNYYLINNQTQDLIMQYSDDEGNIFSKLRDFLMIQDKIFIIEIGLNFLCNLLKNINNDNWHELLQFLPIFPKILSQSSTQNHSRVYIALSFMLEDDRIFYYCKIYQLHSILAESCRNVISQQSTFYLYKCIFQFVKRNYYRTFLQDKVFNGITTILAQKDFHNISSIFFVICFMIDDYWEYILDKNVITFCIDYAKYGCFENKVSAVFCISKFLIILPDQFCDQLANNDDGLQTICEAIEFFDNIDLVLPLRAFRRLIDLNHDLYCAKMLDFDILDYFIDKYDEEVELLKKNTDDATYQEIVDLIDFVNTNLDDFLKENE